MPKLFNKSPYLASQFRLPDLIAAIQVLGTYRFATRKIDKWEKRLGRRPKSADKWMTVFSEHPEFFTIQPDDLVSVVWRRSRERNYDTVSRKVVENDEADRLKIGEQEGHEKRLSRPPLDTTEVSKLVDIAIDLHEREIKYRQERRWWVTAAVGIAGLVVSAFV